MTIKEIREITGLSQAKFAEKYKIPRRTIEDWEKDDSKCKEYIKDLIEFRVKSDYNL